MQTVWLLRTLLGNLPGIQEWGTLFRQGPGFREQEECGVLRDHTQGQA